MAESTPHDVRGHNLNLVMGGCMAIAAAWLIGAVVMAPTIPEATHESLLPTPPTVDVERLQADRASHYPATRVDPAQDDVVKMLADARGANEAQFAQPTDKELHDITVKTLYAANDVITAYTIEGFIPVGQPMYDTCLQAFNALLSDIAAGKVSMEQARRDPGAEHQLYRENCGSALEPLVAANVVTPEGKWADPHGGPHLLEIMNRYRWGSVLDLRKPVTQQLSPYEYELLTRLQAATTSIPVPRRVQRVVAARRVLKELPEKELIGSLLYENGDVAGALGAYGEACSERPSDLVLKRKCEYLREKISVQ